MSKKAFAVVGGWNFKASEKGFCVFNYDMLTGELSNRQHYDNDVGARQQFYDSKLKCIVYS